MPRGIAASRGCIHKKYDTVLITRSTHDSKMNPHSWVITLFCFFVCMHIRQLAEAAAADETQVDPVERVRKLAEMLVVQTRMLMHLAKMTKRLDAAGTSP